MIYGSRERILREYDLYWFNSLSYVLLNKSKAPQMRDLDFE